MKSLSNNFMAITLAMLLGLPPSLTIAMSMPKCMNMSNMNQQMKMSVPASQTDKTSPDTKQCSCDKNMCSYMQCASTTFATTPSNTIVDIAYTISDTFERANFLLLSYYPSSLYRPPKA